IPVRTPGSGPVRYAHRRTFPSPALPRHLRGPLDNVRHRGWQHLVRVVRARTRRADWAGIREPMDRCRLPTHILDIRCLVLLARPAGTALVDRLRRRNSGRYTMLNVQRLTPQCSRPALAMLAPAADRARYTCSQPMGDRRTPPNFKQLIPELQPYVQDRHVDLEVGLHI